MLRARRRIGVPVRLKGVAVAAIGAVRYTAWLRALLLGVVAFGVFNMHSLGHAGPHDPFVVGGVAAAGEAHSSNVMDGVAEYGLQAPNGGTCPSDPCTVQVGDAVPASDQGRDGHGRTLTVLIVCLAVLAGVGVLALLALRRQRSRPRTLRPPRFARIAPLGFGSLPNFPLQLVSVAVLRT